MNGIELLWIIYLVGVEILVGGGGRLEVLIDFCCWVVGVVFGGSDIFNSGFRVGCILIVLVVVENVVVF